MIERIQGAEKKKYSDNYRDARRLWNKFTNNYKLKIRKFVRLTFKQVKLFRKYIQKRGGKL